MASMICGIVGSSRWYCPGTGLTRESDEAHETWLSTESNPLLHPPRHHLAHFRGVEGLREFFGFDGAQAIAERRAPCEKGGVGRFPKPMIGLLVLPITIAPAPSTRSTKGTVHRPRTNAATGHRRTWPATRLEVTHVLHEGGHTVHGAKMGAGHDGLLGLPGCGPGIIKSFKDDGVDRGVSTLDSFDALINQLDRRDLLRRNHRGHVLCAPGLRLRHQSPPRGGASRPQSSAISLLRQTQIPSRLAT